MSTDKRVEPYSAEEIAWIRRSRHDMNPAVVPVHTRWLATIDALRARVEAAEAVVKAARTTHEHIHEVPVDDLWPCCVEALDALGATLRAYDAAHPAPVEGPGSASHGTPPRAAGTETGDSR